MKSSSIAVLFALAALAGACAPQDQSLVVVSVDGPTSVGIVYYLRVVISNGGEQDYHQFPTGAAATPVTLPTSLGFHIPHDRDGDVTLAVDALNLQMNTVASGSGTVTLNVGERVDLCIGLSPTCATGASDGGVTSTDASTAGDAGLVPISESKAAPVGGLPKGLRFSAVSAGTDHGCALGVDGSLWCWGSNASGQLGAGQPSDGLLPLQVPGTSWSAIATGYGDTCAVQSGGGLWCWGNNGSGQLGNGTAQAGKWVGIPLQVSGAGWVSVATGYYHACGIQQDGSLWTWGDNSSDQLGDPAAPSTGRATPGQAGTAAWASVSAGNLHSCGLQVDRTLWCWGNNASGQLGDGTNHMRIAPTQVTGTDWTAVSAGFYHTCALKTDGTLWCWGDNTSGQLGLGTASTTPGQVTAGTAPWTVVTAGQSHTCALQADGTLWCWGENADGQLGIGSNLPSAAPVVVTASPSSWSAVAAGGAHTCAVAGDGTLWCWGANVKGQLGIGSVASQVVPARLGS